MKTLTNKQFDKKHRLIAEKVSDLANRLYEFEGDASNRKIERARGSGVLSSLWVENTIAGIWGILHLDKDLDPDTFRTKLTASMFNTFQNLAIIEAVEDWTTEVRNLRQEYRGYFTLHKKYIDNKYRRREK